MPVESLFGMVKDGANGMIDEVREIVGRHGGIAGDITKLAETADLYEAGMTLFASVDLMLGLEEAFEVEFPDAMLNRKTFSSLRAIADAVATLTKQEA